MKLLKSGSRRYRKPAIKRSLEKACRSCACASKHVRIGISADKRHFHTVFSLPRHHTPRSSTTRFTCHLREWTGFTENSGISDRSRYPDCTAQTNYEVLMN